MALRHLAGVNCSIFSGFQWISILGCQAKCLPIVTLLYFDCRLTEPLSQRVKTRDDGEPDLRHQTYCYSFRNINVTFLDCTHVAILFSGICFNFTLIASLYDHGGLSRRICILITTKQECYFPFSPPLFHCSIELFLRYISRYRYNDSSENMRHAPQFSSVWPTEASTPGSKRLGLDCHSAVTKITIIITVAPHFTMSNELGDGKTIILLSPAWLPS